MSSILFLYNKQLIQYVAFYGQWYTQWDKCNMNDELFTNNDNEDGEHTIDMFLYAGNVYNLQLF